MASAQGEEFSDAGITPDSPLYALDKAIESIEIALTLNIAAKAEKRLKIASERLAELKTMVSRGKIEHYDEALEGYVKNMKEAERLIEKVETVERLRLLEKIRSEKKIHNSALNEWEGDVPEQARKALEKAKEVSSDGKKTSSSSESQNREADKRDIKKETQEKLNKAKKGAQEKSEKTLDSVSDKVADAYRKTIFNADKPEKEQ